MVEQPHPAAAPLRESVERLRTMLLLLNEQLAGFSEAELGQPLAPGRWSRKQILGHLIDSAANNHRRFVLCQLEPPPLRIRPYDQDKWVEYGRYQETQAAELLTRWTLYNRQILRIIEAMPQPLLSYPCTFENGFSVTLGWLIEDYTVHLEHHVRQILDQRGA